MGLKDTLTISVSKRSKIIILGTTLALAGGAWAALAQHKDASAGEAGTAKSGRAEGKGRGDKGRPQSIQAITATAGDLDVVVSALGTATASNTATVKARVDGQLLKVRFREGQWVKAGDVLAEIDPRPYQIQLDQAQGQLLRDQALLNGAKVELARYRDLLTKDSIARQQVDTQEATVHQYEANVVSSRAQAANASLQLGFTRVTAPAAGRLGLRQVDAGNFVRSADSAGLVTITQTQPIHVVFAIPADKLGRLVNRLQNGETLAAEALDQNGKTLLAKGHLLSVDNQIDVSTGTVKLKAEFRNRDNALFPNQFVNVRLTVDTQRNGVLLPAAAVQRGGEGSYVFLVNRQEKTVALRPVVPGHSNGDTVVITQGLAAGDIVVLDGTDKLRPGSKVAVVVLDGKAVGGRPEGTGKQAQQKAEGKRPLSLLLKRSARRFIFPASSSIRSTMPINSLPGSVSPSRRFPLRTYSSTPSSSSRSRICLLTPDWDISNAPATSVRLKLQRTVSRTMRSCWKFIAAC